MNQVIPGIENQQVRRCSPGEHCVKTSRRGSNCVPRYSGIFRDIPGCAAVFHDPRHSCRACLARDAAHRHIDMVDLSVGNFIFDSTETEAGTTYDVYRDGNAQVRVQDGVSVTLAASEAASASLGQERLMGRSIPGGQAPEPGQIGQSRAERSAGVARGSVGKVGRDRADIDARTMSSWRSRDGLRWRQMADGQRLSSGATTSIHGDLDMILQ